MDGWLLISDFPRDEQNRLRWIVRNDAAGLVRAGVAFRYGRSWRINPQRLPDYLKAQTLAALGERAA